MRNPSPAMRAEDAETFEPHTVFVPQDGDREGTAAFLVAAAESAGINQRAIQVHPNGYWITEALAAVVYDDPEPEPEPTDTSGNRAAKKSSRKGNDQ